MSDLLTIDDLLSIRQVAEAQIHPDGSPLVYTISSPVTEFKQQRGTSEIWITDGAAEARRLTAAGTFARRPRWSPDGSRLGFIGRRPDQQTDQFSILDLGWGEAKTVTDCAEDVQSFAWSPDGNSVALLVRDAEPQAVRQRKESGRDQIEYEQCHQLTRLWMCDSDGGNLRQISDVDLHVWEFAWSPDGSTLAALVSEEPYNWAWYGLRLVTFDVAGGAVAELYNPGGGLTRPAWSPDGDRIALIASTWSDQGMTGGDVVLLDTSDGRVVNITEGHPRSYTALEWEQAGDGLIVTAVDDAQACIGTLELGGDFHQLWKGRATIAYYDDAIFSLDRSGSRMAVVRSDPSLPADVWTFDLRAETENADEAWAAHTSTNPHLAGTTLHESETHYWRSFDGATIHGVLLRPTGTTGAGALPMVVLIHGGPTGVTGYDYPGHRSSGWAYLLASSGYAVLMPNPRGSMGFGREFAEANIGDMGGGDLADIMAGVDYCVESGIADPERLGVGGWSYGGYLSAWVATQTARFKAAVAGATITNWTSFHGTSTIPHFDAAYYRSDPFNADGVYTFRSPIFHVRNVTTPVLFLHGEQDPICPPGQAHEMWRALKETGVESQLVVYPREQHGPREREHVRDVLERVVSWFTHFV